MRTEIEQLEKRIRERFVKAFATYHLLEDDDHVLVALSGGKDSLCLLEMLGKRAKIDHPRFRVEAIHVRMENIAYETSTAYLEQFCKDLDIPLHIVTTRFHGIAVRRYLIWHRRWDVIRLPWGIIKTTCSTPV